MTSDLDLDLRRPADHAAGADLPAVLVRDAGLCRGASPADQDMLLFDPGPVRDRRRCSAGSWWCRRRSTSCSATTPTSSTSSRERRSTSSSCVLTVLAMGMVFEMPVVMMMLARVGLVSSRMMRRHWRISIVVLAVIAMLLPGVDPISYWSSTSRCWSSTACRTSWSSWSSRSAATSDDPEPSAEVILAADWVLPVDGPPVAGGAVRWRTGHRRGGHRTGAGRAIRRTRDPARPGQRAHPPRVHRHGGVRRRAAVHPWIADHIRRRKGLGDGD